MEVVAFISLVLSKCVVLRVLLLLLLPPRSSLATSQHAMVVAHQCRGQGTEVMFTNLAYACAPYRSDYHGV